MKEFDLRPLPDLSDAILRQKDQESLNEFINKVDLYLITEESASGDFAVE